MDRTYWQKQTKAQPLFGTLLWSRPENRLHAGKLLVLGGNRHGFAAPAAVYAAAGKAGIGTCHVVLPAALQKTVSAVFPAAEYAASTATSGGFARSALDEWLTQSTWADGVILAGELGRNSETAVLLEAYLAKYEGQLTAVNDAVDYAIDTPDLFIERAETTLVLTMSQLQKLSTAAKSSKPVTSGMALLQLVEFLHDFTTTHAAHIITYHDGTVAAAVNGTVSTTPMQEVELTTVAARAAVWWLQNAQQPFEALTTSVIAD